MSEQIEEKNMQVDETVEEVSQIGETPELHGHDDHAEGVRETDTPDENQGAGSDGHDDQDSSQGHDDPGSDEQDTFPRAYVEKLRKENAGYREKAKRTEALERRLHHALVAADGRLADPSDLPFDAAHLDDPDALAAAVHSPGEEQARTEGAEVHRQHRRRGPRHPEEGPGGPHLPDARHVTFTSQ
ncbi:MAG: hypothetical protein L0K73_09920 [Corynebacterium variabile]|uniref:hypothetical protein n=1 Tax=Corynebacterium variabile TaxID=1727 RepID=UPI002648BDF4|nr:hypothetical protein [Corynebacterium variabile]MDN6537105.1 hypothetical protein [Corynebacterium variabile]